MIEPRTQQDVLDCFGYGLLADVVDKEASGEPFEGKVAVASVVLNRAADPRKRWPDDITGVVMQPSQFSCYDFKDPNSIKRPKPANKVAWRGFLDSCSAAAAALSGDDPTMGANHYLNVATRLKTHGSMPDWYDAEKVTVIIGRHTFLKL